MYKINKGIIIKDIGIIIDLRVGLKYSNEIMYMILKDIKENRLENDVDKYIDNLNIEKDNKYLVRRGFNKCIKKNLIYQNNDLINTSLWSNSRLVMYLTFAFHMLIWILPIIPFIAIASFSSSDLLKFLIYFYVIHLFSIILHESFHALFYWIFQKNNNGYFKINFCHCLFIYNEKPLTKSMRMVVSFCGFLLTVLILLLVYFNTHTFITPYLIEIILQILSFLLGNDGANAIKIMKENKK